MFCNSGHVEDEVHFITECALHAQNRDTMLEQYNIDDTMYNSEQLFIHISGLDPVPCMVGVNLKMSLFCGTCSSRRGVGYTMGL